MICAAALLAATSMLAKILGNDLYGPALHPMQVSAGRFVFAFSALLIVAPFMKLKLTRDTPYKWHLLRSTLGWMGVSFTFAAAAQMPLAEATAITFLSPICTMIFAIPFLGEKVGPVRWSAAAISLAGALILMRPGTDAFQFAALLALAAALLIGLEMTVTKRLSGSEPAIRILFVNNTFGATISVIAASFVWVQPTFEQWLLLILLGLIMVTAQSCFIQAMKSADASFAVPFFYLTLVFAAAYDFGLFGVIPEPISWVGAAVIIAGALFLAYRERQLERLNRKRT
ncbi:MAG: DMT family transporter [Rhodospirillales bacterium]|jgi:drug/metabolite transporter (DMT)-like permease|nr:DMT family transporter [Rhodospirillales bacterium]